MRIVTETCEIEVGQTGKHAYEVVETETTIQVRNKYGVRRLIIPKENVICWGNGIDNPNDNIEVHRNE